jgi:hypothetical protein
LRPFGVAQTISTLVKLLAANERRGGAAVSLRRLFLFEVTMADDELKAPALRHGAYARSPRALKARSRKVGWLVRKMRTVCPWFEESDLPACRAWAEMEVVASRVFAAIVEGDILNAKGEPKRLLDIHRAIRLAQLSYERELGLTPAARKALRASGKPAFDIIGEIARARDDGEE